MLRRNIAPPTLTVCMYNVYFLVPINGNRARLDDLIVDVLYLYDFMTSQWNVGSRGGPLTRSRSFSFQFELWRVLALPCSWLSRTIRLQSPKSRGNFPAAENEIFSGALSRENAISSRRLVAHQT